MPSGKELRKIVLFVFKIFVAFFSSSTCQGRSQRALVEGNTKLLFWSGRILHMEAKSPAKEFEEARRVWSWSFFFGWNGWVSLLRSTYWCFVLVFGFHIPLKVGDEPASLSPLDEETAGALHKPRTFNV